MINNASLKELAEMLGKAETVMLFPHMNPDGDAIGSCAALCRVLREKGKTAWILLDEEVPAYLSFMDTEYCTCDRDCIKDPDICICLDCSEESRFEKRADKFREGRLRLCIDHHATSGSFGDHYYIDADEAATAQIIYKMLKDAGTEISSTVAESLYTGISTDTGGFRHSNTTAETHAITADLFSKGIDHMKIVTALYNSVSFRSVKMKSRILDIMKLSCGGKVATAYVTDSMLAEEGADISDCEGVIDVMKSIEGVELAAFLKEKDGAVRVSMRAKSYGCVDRTAMKFGGGGHVKAAGCTLDMPIEEAAELIGKELAESLGDR